ncbi:MAG: hypothetical protein MSIBF_02230 [Candidatus Altiarchaeales archaeon IMC4]|nr:MAG: hypothetical protein MSIBF_02230 [Candidatus Altiarchaeales archaeon IMC4]
MMIIIPVLDIRGGLAVRAIAGQRERYKPLAGGVAGSSEPVEVAAAFENLGFREMYIADLDGIMKGCPDYPTIEKIKEKTGLALLVDSGVSSIGEIAELKKTGAGRVIVSTESVGSADFPADACKVFGRENIVLSIDVKDGRVLSRCGTIKSKTPQDVAAKFAQHTGEIILLDLSRVGMGEGPNLDLCEKVIGGGCGVPIIYGGGVRGEDDIELLRRAGVSGALVGSAVHSGGIIAR